MPKMKHDEETFESLMTDLFPKPSPAKQAAKTFVSGMIVTVFYTGLNYVLQKAINEMADDYS